jgi:hypothetical protein
VRVYDACRWGRFANGGQALTAVENLPRCGLLARKML